MHNPFRPPFPLGLLPAFHVLQDSTLGAVTSFRPDSGDPQSVPGRPAADKMPDTRRNENHVEKVPKDRAPRKPMGHVAQSDAGTPAVNCDRNSAVDHDVQT